LGWFPRFAGTTRCSDASSPFPPRFVSFARQYRAPPLRRGPPCGGDGASQVPGEPLRARPGLRPRGVQRAEPFAATRRSSASVLPSTSLTAWAPTKQAFSRLHTRLSRSLSTLRSPGSTLRATQDSLPAGGWPWPGRSAGPPWVPSRGFSFSTWASSSPRLCLAHQRPPRISLCELCGPRRSLRESGGSSTMQAGICTHF